MGSTRPHRILTRDMLGLDSRAQVGTRYAASDPWGPYTRADFEGAETVVLSIEGEETAHVPSLDDLRKLSERIRTTGVWTREKN
jgi:hypothetical protein